MQTKTTTHQDIVKASGNQEPTIGQCKYLIYLYKDTIRKKILKRHTALSGAKSSDFPYFFNPKTKIGNFALHLYNQYSVEKELNRGAISNLIDQAKNQDKFDLNFVKSFLDSANGYTKPSA